MVIVTVCQNSKRVSRVLQHNNEKNRLDRRKNVRKFHNLIQHNEIKYKKQTGMKAMKNGL